ncbi:hypothetical protein [Parasitella parasitica]|uniref:Uncharacterized protein n=1 Tax=Parasitella parasitica TaxID=35722 RepID=A0A0B7NPD4_9FUNG|nr:hypothetical protein [Parasitella parasitica]
MVSVVTFVILLYLSTFNIVSAYYGNIYYGDQSDIPPVGNPAAVAVQDTVYLFGGSLPNNDPNYAMTTLKFDSDQNLLVNTFESEPLDNRKRCRAFSLGDNKTIVAVNVEYPPLNVTRGHPFFNISAEDTQGNVTTLRTAGLSFYDIASHTWSSPQNNSYLPPFRGSPMAAISPENDAIYTMGGMYFLEDDNMLDIFRFDLKNVSSVVNLTAIHPNLKLDMVFGTAQMLPNGIIVIAFGMNNVRDLTLLNTTHVTLFDTRKNEIYNQPVSGVPPTPRFCLGSALGPDKSTIYYYGGGDQKTAFNPATGTAIPNLVALDTTTWTWIYPNVPGLAAVPYVFSALTLLENSKLITLGGSIGSVHSMDIGVIVNVPQSSAELQNSQMQWFTNNPEIDQAYLTKESRKELSQGAIAGIIIGVLVVVALIITLLWKRFPKVRRIGNYIQNEIIWQPRSGEPLWAETARLLVRFILFFLFLAFVVYSVYRAVESPIVTQEIRTPTNTVGSPDIRFCFDGFDYMDPNQNLSVSCAFRNGTDCSGQIIELDMNVYTPTYPDQLGDVTCFMFRSDPAYSFIDDKMSYSQTTSTKMLFTFQGPPRLSPNGTSDGSGAIYIDTYAPGYNPNVVAYNLTTGVTQSKLPPRKIREWELDEQGSNMLKSIILKPSVRTTASFAIVEKRELRRDDGWNLVGFSSNYDKSYDVENFFKDAPQNIELLESSVILAQLTLQPSAFTININNEQKVFTLLNAFAQVGGVLGLFIALQTILFGFRPQSPWGIVHRWSFGKLRVKLTDRLANYFDRMGTPVPLVNPVSRRLSTVFKNNAYSSVPGYSYADEEAYSQENRVHQVEERLQLMELLLKSYYLNDEVFRSLDQAVKRGNEERRRSSGGGADTRNIDDAVMMSGDDSIEVIELSNSAKAAAENDSTVAINRQTSYGASPQQRSIYQPNLAPNETNP